MKVSPVASPAAIQQPQPTNSKARAIEAFNKASQAQAQEHPVQNPSQVSVEELGAIKASTSTETPEISDKSTDVSTEVTQEPKAEDPALSRQFAQLARQERALRAKAQQQDLAYKQREADLAAREAAIKAQPQFNPNDYIPKSRIKQDALTVLEENDVPYDDLTQQAMARQPTDPRIKSTISRLEAKIAELEKANESTQQSYREQQQSQYNAAVKQIESDTRALVRNDPNFETIKATGAVKDVVELITETYNKDGVLLTVEEAAQQVEDYLIEEAMKVTRIGKIKQRIEQANASQAKSDVKTQATTKQTQSPMKTLTNATASSRQLSAKERAILAFKGELKA